MDKELLTIPEVCEATGLGRTYIYYLLKEGALKAIKIGRRTLIRQRDMDMWTSTLSSYSAAHKE